MIERMGKRRNRGKNRASSQNQEHKAPSSVEQSEVKQQKLLASGGNASEQINQESKNDKPHFPSQTMTMENKEQKDQSGKMFTTALIAFIIGFVLAFLIFGTGEKQETPAENGSEMTKEMEEHEGGEMMEKEEKTSGLPSEGTGGEVTELPKTLKADISAENQLFGETVDTNVETDRVSWVVVYEDTNGVPGNILGAKIVDIGRFSVQVKLLRGTLPDRLYYVKLQADDGDHKFDFTKDLPMTNQITGQEIMTAFRTHDGSPR